MGWIWAVVISLAYGSLATLAHLARIGRILPGCHISLQRFSDPGTVLIAIAHRSGLLIVRAGLIRIAYRLGSLMSQAELIAIAYRLGSLIVRPGTITIPYLIRNADASAGIDQYCLSIRNAYVSARNDKLSLWYRRTISSAYVTDKLGLCYEMLRNATIANDSQ